MSLGRLRRPWLPGAPRWSRPFLPRAGDDSGGGADSIIEGRPLLTTQARAELPRLMTPLKGEERWRMWQVVRCLQGA